MTLRRVGITVNSELDKQIRTLQAKLLLATNKSWNYSSTLNLLIEEGLDALRHKKMCKNEKPNFKEGHPYSLRC